MKRFFVTTLMVFAALIFVISCGGGSSKPENGSEDSVSNFGKLGSECYPNKTCDEGLLCDAESNICVEDSDNPTDDSDISSENDDETNTTSGKDNDSEQNDSNDDPTTDPTSDNDSDTVSEHNDDDADSSDSAPDSDDSDTTNENSDNLPDCSPTSATPCIDPENDLIWSGKSTEKMPWADAVNYCKELSDGGFNDWRLPSKLVLGSLVQNCDKSSGCEGDTDGKYSKFGDVVFLWSSTTSGSSTASGISFFNGATLSKSVDQSFNVRCVRNLKCDEVFFSPILKKCVNPCDDHPNPCPFTSVDYTNCIAYTYQQHSCGGKDPSSGLTWSTVASNLEKFEDGYFDLSMTWEKARLYCENLTESGYSNWHLPTISELRTLIENCSNNEMPNGSCGVIDTGDSSTSCLSYSDCWTEQSCRSCNFSDGSHTKFEWDDADFWSSSTVSDNTAQAWYVDFLNGNVDKTVKGIRLYVRCVR